MGKAIDDYLSRRDNLVGIVLEMDARRPLQPFDKHMIDWAQTRTLPVLALLNKADKLKRNAQAQALRTVQGRMTERWHAAQTGLGGREAVGVVQGWLAAQGNP